MTNNGNSAQAARWPIRDPRTYDQLEQDKEDVRKQVTALSERNANAQAAAAGYGDDPRPPDREEILDRIRRRQLTLAENEGTRFAVYTSEGGQPVLVAENQLVVDADDEQLGTFGDLLSDYAAAGRIGRRKSQVFYCRDGKGITALMADARRIREKQPDSASLNTIVPLGYVVKGDAYPGRTTGLGDFSPGTGGSPVRVAIIDTGLNKTDRSDDWLPDVAAQDVDQLNIVAPFTRNDYHSGHGTFTTGIVRQIAPDCEVVVYRFTKADGLGTDDAAADMMTKAADDAAGMRLIINASFGAPAVDGVPPLALQEAVRDITTRYPEVLIVASAGNDGDTRKLYPAAFDFPQVKAVGALNADLTGADFSNHGDWLHCSAVGVGVVSTFVKGTLPPEDNLGIDDVTFDADNSWATWSGTSFTAPQISAAVAYLCGQDPTGTLLPGAAFDQLIAGRDTLEGFGVKVHLLPGTPT